MSKQVTHWSLSLYATRIVECCAAKAEASAMRAVMLEFAPTLKTTREKIECDNLVVKGLAKRYGVKATPAEKNGRLSGLTFSRTGHDDPTTMALYHRAAQALNAARNQFIDKKAKAPTSPVESAKERIAKLLNDAEYRSEAVRAVKQLMLLVKSA